MALVLIVGGLRYPLHIYIRTLSTPAPKPLNKYGLGYGMITICPNLLCFHRYLDPFEITN